MKNLLLLLTCLAVFSIGAAHAAADELRDLTAQVLASRTSGPAKTLAPAAAQRAAERRQDLFAGLIATDPARAVREAISAADRVRLPNNVSAFVETQERLVGTAVFLPGPASRRPMFVYQFAPTPTTAVAPAPLILYAATRLDAVPTGPTQVCGVRVRQVLALRHCPESRAVQAPPASLPVSRVAAAPPAVAVPITIRATNATDPTLFSETTVVYMLQGLTPGPVGLVNTTAFQFTWTPNADTPTYAIDRAVALAGPYAEIGTTAVAAYTDAGLPPGAFACYRVRGIDAAGVSSSPSDALCTQVTQPPPPGGGAPQLFTYVNTGKPQTFTAAGDPPYACVRAVGALRELRILSGASILKRVTVDNPDPKGETFTIACLVSATQVTATLATPVRTVTLTVAR